MPQQQIQRQDRKQDRKNGRPADAPTVNSKISRLWFREGGQ